MTEVSRFGEVRGRGVAVAGMGLEGKPTGSRGCGLLMARSLFPLGLAAAARPEAQVDLPSRGWTSWTELLGVEGLDTGDSGSPLAFCRALAPKTYTFVAPSPVSTSALPFMVISSGPKCLPAFLALP